MKKFLAAFLAAWLLLAFLSSAQIMPVEVLKTKEINSLFRGGEAGAIELSWVEISEATDDPFARYMGLLPKKSLPSRAYGSASPVGWSAYVAQDAQTSWVGEGMAAYALWS